MNNLERLLTIQANGDTSWLNGAHYVLNNFMPNWVRVEDGLPERKENWYLVRANLSTFIMWYGLMNDGSIGWFYEGEPVKPHLRPTHYMNIPQPPNE